MPRRKTTTPATPSKRKIETYEHVDKERVNNPPVGLVTPETDQDAPAKAYQYDPHLDPQLVWAGKAEHTSFEVPTVSLHVHERIDPRTIMEAVRKKNGGPQPSLFATQELPLRQAIDFYKHKHGWSNRLIAGDSLLVMNSLLEKEGMAGQVQMVYMDPPYGITYKSNFQPFTNKKDVSEGKDSDVTQEPEMIRAFRDTWQLGIHSYLTYLRDRLLLSRALLNESGSIFVQISDENIHHVRELLDEVFGSNNFVSIITYRTSVPLKSTGLASICDYILWYAKDSSKKKHRDLFVQREIGEGTVYTSIQLPDGTRRKMTTEERSDLTKLPRGAAVYCTENLVSSGYTPTCIYPFEYEGQTYNPTSGKSWKTNRQGMGVLARQGRLDASGKTLRYVLFLADYPVMKLTNMWTDLKGESNKVYVVQTALKVIQRCMLMATDPGDLVFDLTCGSGSSALVAEDWGRRWITCDTSRIALTLTKQRLMTHSFDYYELAQPKEGIGSGLKYNKVPHVTLGSIAQNEPPDEAILVDYPIIDPQKTRVAGPFTVEAVPAPVVKPLHEIQPDEAPPADASIARSGATVRQADWRDELLKTGIRAKGGQRIEFSRVEPLPGTRWLHADAETKEASPQRVVVSFGPEHAPLGSRQVELAIGEARTLVPQPRIIVFAAFHLDPEARKNIEGTKWPGITLLEALMNADLLTEDLKKKRASNESFWLIGQPDAKAEPITKGPDKGKYQARVLGFDYYNTRTGKIESGGTGNIAMWMLDPDYDGRSLFPRQVFFPMAGDKEGWAKLAKNLKAEIDEDLIEAYRGVESLPFTPGEHKRVAVKIIDDRGIESLKIIEVE
jgi:adenine-specific DNA-methyltransferase